MKARQVTAAALATFLVAGVAVFTSQQSAAVSEQRRAHVEAVNVTVEHGIHAQVRRAQTEKLERVSGHHGTAVHTARELVSETRTVLATSAGKVLDNASRAELAASLGRLVENLNRAPDTSSAESVETHTLTLSVAARPVHVGTERVFADMGEWKAEQERKAREAREAEEAARAAQASQDRSGGSDTSSAGGGTTSATPTPEKPSSAAPSGRDVAESEAARLGVPMRWGGSHYGEYHGRSGVILVGTQVQGFSHSKIRAIVRHEAAHLIIERHCGTHYVPWWETHGRAFERVTDAYADMYLGGLSWMSYGYNSNDAAIAQAVRAGQCP